MEPLPFFSALITNYNYERFVGEAIASVLAQDYPADRFEVIVVDDGSQDGSRAVIERHAADPRVRCVLQPNRGQSAAFAAGLAVARGDYVCLLDSDDLFLPGKFRRVAAHIASLGHPRDLMLCHDLHIEDTRAGRNLPYTWFEMMKIGRDEAARTPEQVTGTFPFANPCGMVAGRAGATAFFEALPTWAFPRGVDITLGHALLLMAGRVDYVGEPLATYRVHGDNELATTVDGEYRPRFETAARLPKMLRFLEQWVDLLDLPAARRAGALAYLRRLEYLGRMPSESLRADAPLVSVVVLGNGDAAALAASLEAAALQSHPAVELVLPEDTVAGAAAMTRPQRRFADDPALPDHARLARGWAAASGAFVMFVGAGNLPDRTCVERHVYVHRHGALAGASASDFRLIDRAGALLHADVFATSGAWKLPFQHVPPLAGGLADWSGAPLSACMFRKSELLDRFFAQPGEMPATVRDDAAWLMLQLAQQSTGLLRMREGLCSVVAPDGAAASYGYLASPARLDGALAAPQVREAALWLQEFYLDHEEAFLRWLPPAWHRRFEPWLDRHTA